MRRPGEASSRISGNQGCADQKGVIRMSSEFSLFISQFYGGSLLLRKKGEGKTFIVPRK